MSLKKLLFIMSLFITITAYEPKGNHYVAKYSGCHYIFSNEYSLFAFNDSLEKSGIPVVSTHYHFFKPNGMTAIALLSESHASIHTYPEHKVVFVDLFTCGDTQYWLNFENHLKKYLSPDDISYSYIKR